MNETSENVRRTVAAPAEEAVRDEEWGPAGAEAPGATDGGDGAWTSPEAPAAGGPPAVPSQAATDPRSYTGPERTAAVGPRTAPVPSVAAINGHPIHPMLVPLPIGAFTFALVSDVAYAATGDRFFARASQALLGAGIVTGLAAGAVGALDFVGRERVREHSESWAHAGGNVAAVALSAVNLAIRRGDPGRGALPTGMVLSAITGGRAAEGRRPRWRQPVAGMHIACISGPEPAGHRSVVVSAPRRPHMQASCIAVRGPLLRRA
jgi:uncharacterized membrane protein